MIYFNIYRIHRNCIYTDIIINDYIKIGINIEKMNYKNKIYKCTKILCILQIYKLYIYLIPHHNSEYYLSKCIGCREKCIYYLSNFKSNKKLVYFNFYLIYMIKKYYFNKDITYNYHLDDIKSRKNFNKTNLYKIVALIT
jgi:hypothetical protein